MINEYLSTWNLVRMSGFLAYFLFTISISAGLISRLSIFQKQKQLFNEIHTASSWFGLLTTFFHITVLLVDHYAPYKMKEIFIPFSAENAPISSAFGTISFYFFLIVIASSDFFRKRLGYHIWKKLHFIVIPAWLLMILHGILIGTDSGLPWATSLYSGGIVLVIISILFRYTDANITSRRKQSTSFHKLSSKIENK